MTEFYIYLPRNLAVDALKTLSPEYREKYGDSMLYFLYRIYTGCLFKRKKRRRKYCDISSAYIRRFFPDRTAYTKIKNALISKNIIQCDNLYAKKSKSFGFRLNCRKYAEPAPIQLEDRRLIDKIKKYFKKLTPKLWVHQKLKDCLEEIQIEDLRLIKPKNMISHQLIKSQNYFLSVDNYGRVHTNITNMSSKLRKHLKVDDKKLVNIDIRNSQPLFLSTLLGFLFKQDLKINTVNLNKDKYISLLLPYDVKNEGFLSHLQELVMDGQNFRPDVINYTQLCEQGRFYDWLMTEMNIPLDDRRKFKRRFFAKVFFCENKPTEESEFFKKYFPSVHAFITLVKSKDYSLLAKMLQRIESLFIIETVVARCFRERRSMFLTTIHDSILVLPSDVEFVLRILKEEFAKINLEPIINPEYY